MTTNLSRDRHDCTFDGAERDVTRLAQVRQAGVFPVPVEQVWAFYGNRSRGRHGCVFEDAERDESWWGKLGYGRAWRCSSCRASETTFSVSERAAASVAEWDLLMSG